MTVAIDIIANNGTVGGGEVMMVALARCARELGVPVRIVAPRRPAGALELARGEDLDVLEIPAVDRRTYFGRLATRRDMPDGRLWWCNGLVPALATVGSRQRRIVHLHQIPSGPQRMAWQVGRRGVERVFVPSRSLQASVPGSEVLMNWTDELAPATPAPDWSQGVRIGFIGRFSPIKGLDVLARAVQRLDRFGPVPVSLVLAGDARLVPDAEAARVEAALANVRDVERLGWVPREMLFDAVDVVVAPSVWPESFGLVAAEAMAFGRPIVVSDSGALPEVVGIDHPWVARAGDVADTARVIGRLLATPPDEIDAWRRAARARWEAEFSPAAGMGRVRRTLTTVGVLDHDEVSGS